MGTSSGPALSNERRRAGRALQPWILLVAGRYVRTQRRERKNVTNTLSMVCLCIGAAVLITVLSIMNGFQLRQIESIIAFDSYHLRLGGVSAERLMARPSAVHDLRAGVKGIRTIVPFADVEGMARGYLNESIAVRLRALPVDVQGQDDGLMRALAITDGAFDIARPNSVVLGEGLARALGLVAGDQIHVMVLPAGSDLGAARECDLTVSGVFNIGFYEFDNNAAIVGLPTARSMVGDQLDLRFGVKLEDREADWAAEQDIARVLTEDGLASPAIVKRDLVSWRQYNAAIFGALRMEKLMIILLVGLIFIVVAVNIYHGLRRSVFEKSEDIGVLRALGAPSGAIRLIFVLEGCLVGLVGAGVGVALGVALSLNIDALFHGVEAAANAIQGLGGPRARVSLFLANQMPSRLLPGDAVGVGLVAFLSAALAGLAASWRVSRIKPAEILRNE